MKGHKGGGKSSQGLASADREPLFPRLHVNETEKAGPKAPPRNKMALYEQFTVPSHGFVQPSPGTTTTVFRQAYGSGYPYFQYDVPSAPYAQTPSQPSQVTSSSGITSGSLVVNEFSKAPKHHKAANLTPCKVSRGCKELPHTSDKSDSFPETIGPLKEDIKGTHQLCDGPNVYGFPDCQRSNCMFGGFAAPHDPSETWAKPIRSGVVANSQKGDEHELIPQSLTNDDRCFMQISTSLRPSSLGERGANLATEDQNVMSAQCRGSGLSLAANKSSRIQRAFQTQPGVKKVDKIKGADLGNSDIKSSKELKAKVDKEHDVSQPAYNRRPVDTSADFTPLIKPKDVIRAIGQQQFWKARKTLLRQQRIFSEQVFQLHKLIMIQQLLAETPGTLINEELHIEAVEECDARASLAKWTINPGSCARNAGDSKKGSKNQLVDTKGSPAVSKDAKKEVKVSMPDPVRGGVSAWGYPSLGQWMGLMASQGQPYGYQPSAGALPPGSAFGLPYGSALPGSASPMVSFGIPYCGQRQELQAEMVSNYGPATLSKLDGNRFMNGNVSHYSNDYGSSWYFMQHNALNYQRVHSTGSGKDASTGSGASVNKTPVSAAQVVKTSCFPGLAYHWGVSSQTAGLSNTEGLESAGQQSAGQQSEISSPSIATGLACSATLSTSPTRKLGLSHKRGEARGQNFEMVHISQRSDSRSCTDKEGKDARACSKFQQEGSQSCFVDGLVDASVHASDLGCALELFPRVPTTNSSGRNRHCDPKAVEAGFGHVIRAVPRRAIAASESAAGILFSLQQEKQK